jgi:galactoside O-acetyltransferase
MDYGAHYLTEVALRKLKFRRVGKDIKISSRVSLYGTENISLDSHIRIDDFTVIVAANGPLTIGNYVTIQDHCFLGCRNGIIMDDFSGLSPGVMIFSSSDDYLGRYMTGSVVPKHLAVTDSSKVTLGRHVVIGAGSIILPGCALGEGVAVGALSLVKTDLEPWGVYAGIPVKKLKIRSKRLLLLEQKVNANQPRKKITKIK